MPKSFPLKPQNVSITRLSWVAMAKVCSFDFKKVFIVKIVSVRAKYETIFNAVLTVNSQSAL